MRARSACDRSVSVRHRAAAAIIGILLSACGSGGDPEPDTVSVAVASNFAEVERELAGRFESLTGGRVLSSSGATGQLYAQIRSGAPFEVFLAADAIRPQLLVDEGLAVPGTVATFAIGRLVLYGPGLDSVRSGGTDLLGNVTNLAIANPRTAPYGEAAEAVLARVGADPSLRSRTVRGENVGQALQFVRSGAAELGFVALSQVIREPRHTYWLVPDDFHAPLLHDAVLLRPGETDPLALRYLEFLRGAEARGVIESFGYATGPDS